MIELLFHLLHRYDPDAKKSKVKGKTLKRVIDERNESLVNTDGRNGLEINEPVHKRQNASNILGQHSRTHETIINKPSTEYDFIGNMNIDSEKAATPQDHFSSARNEAKRTLESYETATPSNVPYISNPSDQNFNTRNEIEQFLDGLYNK